MGWSGSLNANSAVGAAITYTPDTTTNHGYTVDTFTAPKKGVYRFILKGSGGASKNGYAGGAGGYTVGYLLLEANQVVYVGAGGPYSAAFVSKAIGSDLKNITKANLYFVAGAGGGGGAAWGSYTAGFVGGKGGGASGSSGGGDSASTGGAGGTQSSGYAYGVGGTGGYSNDGDSLHAGDGGDGLYGGKAGSRLAAGGGGSGYIHTTSVAVQSKTYTNSTAQGGGAGSDGNGSVQVSYYARAELPVSFDDTTLERIIFNGVEIESLIFNGTKLFFERLRKEMAAWFMWTKSARYLRALT